MSLEDPFFVVKEEVTRSLTRLRNLHESYANSKQQGVVFSKDGLERTLQDIKSTVKSLEWDLEDLEDTIAVVEKNPGRFRLSDAEVVSRRFFIQQTKDEVAEIKTKLQALRGRESEKNGQKPLLEKMSAGIARPSTGNSAGYVRIPVQDDDDDDDDSGTQRLVQQQSALMRKQDEQIVLISDSVGTLKTMSRQIGNELDDQAIMLDDLGHDMENAQSKMDSTMKKMAKVLRLSNDRRQWMAIGVLSGILVLVIILFFAI